MKNLLPILVLSLLLAGFMPARCPAGDLNPAPQSEKRGGVNAVPLVINEFMASNSSCIQDPQGQYDDWVEIYNYGTDAIDIAGMYLTDNLSVPTKWRIPDGNPAAMDLAIPAGTIIPAGGFLLIWADSDTPQGVPMTADAGLHANFKLSADGEEIGLFDIDGSTLIDGVVFLEQTADISYGRYPDANDVWRFIATPTPGAENTGGYLGLVTDPEFSRGHGFYTAPFSVTIATETENAVIYYTLDGSEPYNTSGRGRHPGGIVYTNPIPITMTTHLRVKAIKPGWKPSNIETQSYIFLEPDAKDFSSNLPIAVIDTFGEFVGQTTQTQTLTFAGFIDTTNRGRAKITNLPDFVGRAGLNIRGKSSAGFAKKQYHFETLDEYDGDKDVSILGFPAESDWVLQAPYSDKSLMRNFLAYKWSNDIGRYAVRTRFIELFLNTDGGGVSMSDYVGVYVLMEKIKQGENRVNIVKLEPSDNAEPQITGGYIIKKDKLDPDDVTFNTSTGLQLIYVEPNGVDITQAQMDWIKSYINEFESVLYGPNFADPINGYAAYIDVDSFIDHHILVELTKNIDGFRLSTYMFKDRDGKLNMGPVWDYNLSLGNANYLDGWIPTGWYYDLLSDGDYPWWRRLFQDPKFRLRYADRWFGLRKSLFSTGSLLKDIDDASSLLDEAQVRNFDCWKILGVPLWPNWFIAQTYQEEIDWMKGWLEERLTWMDTQIGTEFAAAPPVFSRQGGEISAGDTLSMTGLGRSPIIYYTLDGSDPRSTTVSLPSIISTTLMAENASKRVFVPTGPAADGWKSYRRFNDSTWLACNGSPGGVGYSRSSDYTHLISLNLTDQMLRKNATCYIRIPFTFDGDSEDFDSLTLKVRYDDGFVAYLNEVEVARRNFTGTPTWNSEADAERLQSEAVNFENIDISAFLNDLRRGDNLLAIHGLNYLTISSDFLISVELIANKSIPPFESNASSNVLRYTEPITLTHSTHVKARVLRGGIWSALNEATFTIGPVADNLRITEIMYHPLYISETPRGKIADDANDPNEEYIELTNIGTETVNLNLAKFTNGIDFTFPSLELTPNEYVVVVQDRNAFEARYGQGVNIAGQYAGRLNNGGERIRLEDAIGQMILDFDYKDGWHSITDGDGFSLTVIEPTNTDPDSWNEKDSWRASAYLGGSPGTDDSVLIPDPGAVVINEVLANSPAGAADWIELHNTTDTSIDIGGWFLSDSGSNLMKYEIAKGTTIAPGGYILFYEDLHFSNPSAPSCHKPFALSESGEQIYLSSAEGGVLTGYRQVEDFGASETDVSFGRYYKPGTGNLRPSLYNFVPMAHNTPGSANAYPKVGPIVINEIMYNPDWPEGGSYTNDQYEYVELHNIGAEPVTLYDYDKAQPWKFTDGIDFTFP
ncbi:MAG: CotH kinase family protein, partial [Sedimentisphaerales bacterium]